MESTSLQPATHSPLDSIRQCKDGQEYWSARDLQMLLGYTEWRNFEKTIKKAMTACRNVGQKPQDCFVDTNKPIMSGKGRVQEVNDYHLSRFACYLTAMNGDPDKPEIAQAQTYFALKTREAELQPASTEPIYTVADALRDRWIPNMKQVPRGFFTTPGELSKHLHNLEKLINTSLDNQSEIEKSVGRRWSDYARNVLRIPEDARCRYPHVCPSGRVVYPWAYSMLYVGDFDLWLRARLRTQAF